MISCVDICTEYSVMVCGSKSKDSEDGTQHLGGSILLWECQTGRLIRHIQPAAHHANCRTVQSVSINRVCGHVTALLSRPSQLYIFSINGDLLFDSGVSWPTAHPSVSTPPIPRSVMVSPATVAIALPCGEWQKGVVAMTGHDNGVLSLWKVRSVGGDKDAGMYSSNAPTYVDQPEGSVGGQIATATGVKELYVASQLNGRGCAVTALSLGESPGKAARLPLVPRLHVAASSCEVLVGDADGNVSRWMPHTSHS